MKTMKLKMNKAWLKNRMLLSQRFSKKIVFKRQLMKNKTNLHQGIEEGPEESSIRGIITNTKMITKIR